jgi:DNA-binding NtrC family response regulator/tetratricopeptide (TPR) repeat protein
VARLIQDRYLAYDEIHGCDLATGEDVRLDELPTEPAGGFEASGCLGDVGALAPLVEILNDGRDGDPRWVVAEARNGAQAAAMAARAAADARRRGFVPLLVPLYLRWRDALAVDLDERTLLLIGSFARGLAAARAALVQAAASSPRPHVLLTFADRKGPRRISRVNRKGPRRIYAVADGKGPRRSSGGSPRRSDGGAAAVVREARAAYGATAAAGRPRTAALPPDVVRLIERGAHAAEFQKGGRHAAAERLLRDVAGSLARRQALVPSAATLVTLGRMLMERGRAGAAEKAFDEAAQLAHTAQDEASMLDARLWQAAARTDAARLTDAEAMCRAVLLTRQLSPARQAWAMATLARVLLWQGRSEEAAASLPSVPAEAVDIDAITAASIDAIAVRVLLVMGDVFRAGQHARQLMTRVGVEGDPPQDPLPRLIARTAHLRVLAAAGDLELACQCLQTIAGLARQARTPLRAIRARLIWHDALQRAGRTREAQSERLRLARTRRATPALLRRAIDERVTASDPAAAAAPMVLPAPARVASTAASLLQLVHEEESDRRALERIAGRLARELQATRVDLVSCDAGPVSTLVTHGAGLATQLGPRVLEAGLVLSDEVEGGGHEIGSPIRLGTRLLAGLVCRWPLDRRPPAHAADLLEVAAAVAAPRAEALLTSLRETSHASTSVPELIGVSTVMQEVRRAIERAAKAPFAVLVEGESGVGKELVARAVHQLSARRERRFCDVNCAALPDDLLESELFGHVRGAFTGAVGDKAGLFEEADGGTLFLDEVPDLSPRGQAKLLRVLQQHEVRRIGETFSRKVDVRLVAAANRDMRQEAAQERFRSDLLYRIDVIRIRMPPLRERPEDIALLAQHFWRSSAARVECAATLTHALLAELARYHWPGNVRELQNVMAALAVAAPARGQVRAALLPPAITGAASVTARRLSEARAQFERRCVEVALARAGGSRTRAAAELGLSRQGLMKTMARLGLGAPPEDSS